MNTETNTRGFHVTVINQGLTFWLRGTTWAFEAERGNTFETIEEAQAAIEKARKFMAPKIKKAVKIVPV